MMSAWQRLFAPTMTVPEAAKIIEKRPPASSRNNTNSVTALFAERTQLLLSLRDRDCRANVIRCAFKAAGIEFIDENGGGPGVRLKKAPKKRT
jgi:hypothetical protein